MPKKFNELPPSSSASTTISAFERDAVNHWMKWGCGGKPLADELQHLAEEIHHVCAGTEGKWFGGARAQRVHEQLCFIAHGLSQQETRPSTKGGNAHMSMRPYHPVPRTPPTVAKGENARLRGELAAARAKVDSLEQTFAAYVRSKDQVKHRDRWMQKWGLKGRLFAYDIAITCRAYAAWSKQVCCDSKASRCKQIILEVGDRSADIVESSQNKALLSKCIGFWAATHRVCASRKRLVQTLGDWYDIVSANTLAALESKVRLCMAFWSLDARTQRMQRQLADGESNLLEALQKAMLEKQRLLERFGANALASMRRAIALDVAAAKQHALSAWVVFNKESREERKAQLEAEAARKLRDRRLLAASERMLGKSVAALRIAAFTAWRDAVEATKLANSKLNESTSLAMKMILGSEAALMLATFHEWHARVEADRLEHTRADLLTARKLLDKFRQRALAMLQNHCSNAKLVSEYFLRWRDETELGKLRRQRKECVMLGVIRLLTNQEVMLSSLSVRAWSLIIREERRIAEAKALSEKESRGRFLQLAQGTIMRLHRRLAVTHVFDEWLKRAITH